MYIMHSNASEGIGRTPLSGAIKIVYHLWPSCNAQAVIPKMSLNLTGEAIYRAIKIM